MRLCGQIDYASSARVKGRVRWNKNRLDFLLGKIGKSPFEIFNGAIVKAHNRERGIDRGSLRFLPLRHVQRVRDVDEDTQTCSAWQQFSDQVELFCRELLGEVGEPGNIASRTGQALNQAKTDGIGTRRHHN